MIDVKQAVRIAKEKAKDMLDASFSNLEEVERESYKDHDVWSITLSVPRPLEADDQSPIAAIAALAARPTYYKRFLIDAETGELVAMKLREVAMQ